MTVLDELRTWRDAEPFSAFIIQMKSGHEYVVAKPDDIGIPPVNTDGIFIAGEAGGPLRLGVASIVGIRKRSARRQRKAG